MAAFGAAAVGAFATLLYWLALRGRGGWRAVNRARRGENPVLDWSELATIEKAWFYGIPLFGAASFGFFLLGLVLLATGHE